MSKNSFYCYEEKAESGDNNGSLQFSAYSYDPAIDPDYHEEKEIYSNNSSYSYHVASNSEGYKEHEDTNNSKDYTSPQPSLSPTKLASNVYIEGTQVMEGTFVMPESDGANKPNTFGQQSGYSYHETQSISSEHSTQTSNSGYSYHEESSEEKDYGYSQENTGYKSYSPTKLNAEMQKTAYKEFGYRPENDDEITVDLSSKFAQMDVKTPIEPFKREGSGFGFVKTPLSSQGSGLGLSDGSPKNFGFAKPPTPTLNSSPNLQPQIEPKKQDTKWVDRFYNVHSKFVYVIMFFFLTF